MTTHSAMPQGGAPKSKPKTKRPSPWRYSSFAKDRDSERIIPASARMGLSCPR